MLINNPAEQSDEDTVYQGYYYRSDADAPETVKKNKTQCNGACKEGCVVNSFYLNEIPVKMLT